MLLLSGEVVVLQMVALCVLERVCGKGVCGRVCRCVCVCVYVCVCVCM